MKGKANNFLLRVAMKVYCHGIECCKNGLTTYVQEVVVYNEKGRVFAIFEDCDYEAVAIFGPTAFVIKKNNKYFWSEIQFTLAKAQTIDNLENGKNYVKENGTWMLIMES